MFLTINITPSVVPVIIIIIIIFRKKNVEEQCSEECFSVAGKAHTKIVA